MQQIRKEGWFYMEGTTKFKSLGVVDLEGASIGDGQIEVHMPIDEASEEL